MKGKFATQEERRKFESFARNHINHILKAGNLSHYWLRCLEGRNMKNGMEVRPDPMYLSLEVDYDEEYASEQFREKNWEELLRTFCHEVTHIITAEIEVHPQIKKLSKILDPIYERFTEHASRWLYQVYTTTYMPEHGIEISTGVAKKKLQ